MLCECEQEIPRYNMKQTLQFLNVILFLILTKENKATSAKFLKSAKSKSEVKIRMCLHLCREVQVLL
mgnify:CR=1 FL=1